MHKSPLTTVDVAPSSGLVASGGYDGRICLWREAGKVLWSAVVSDLVNHVAFSPDGSRLAAASADGYVYLFNVADGSLRGQLGPHLDDVNAVAWHPNGTLLACVTDAKDTRVALWNAATGMRAGYLEGHEHGVFAVAFSPDGTELVTAAEDGTARIWSIETGAQRAVLHHPGDPETVSWSPCGTAIATGCDDGILRIWGSADGTLKATSDAASAAVRLVRFSPDAKRLLAGSYEGVVRVHAFPSLEVIGSFAAPFQWERSAAFCGQDGLVVGSFGAGPVVHRPPQPPLLPPQTFGINAIAGVPGGPISVGRDDGAIVDIRDGRRLYEHPSIVNGIGFGPNGLMASGDYKGSVIVYDWSRGIQVARRDLTSGPVNATVFDSSGQRLFAAGYDGVIRTFSPTLDLLNECPAHDGPIKSLAWNTVAGVLVAGSSDDSLSGWKDGRQLYRVRQDDLVLINCVAASPVAPHVATASRDGLIRIWCAETGALLDALPPAHTKSAKAVAYSSDGQTLLSGAYDGLAHLWVRDADGWRIHRLSLHGKPGVPAVMFDGRAAVTAGWDGTVGRWCPRGTLIAQYQLLEAAELAA